MSGLRARPAHPVAPVLAAQSLFQRLWVLVGGLGVGLGESLHLGEYPDVLLRTPLPTAGVLDELIGGEVDGRPAGLRIVGTVVDLVGDARAVDDVPDQRAVDLWCRTHR